MKKLLIATMLLISTPALATTCKIVGIADGDTATCLTSSKNQIKIRFDQISPNPPSVVYGRTQTPFIHKILGVAVQVARLKPK